MCHGARANDHKAAERRRRAIEAKAKSCAASANADSLASPTGEQEAVDAAGDGRSREKEEEGEDAGRVDSEEKITQEELLRSSYPILIPLSEEGAWRVNPRLVTYLTMEDDQKSTTNRKTCDEGDSQDKNHTSKSGRGEE